jgi:hypothetical protein
LGSSKRQQLELRKRRRNLVGQGHNLSLARPQSYREIVLTGNILVSLSFLLTTTSQGSGSRKAPIASLDAPQATRPSLGCAHVSSSKIALEEPA